MSRLQKLDGSLAVPWRRDAVIDVIRGFAIVVMVIWHGVMWFSETRNCHVQSCDGSAGIAWWAVVYVGSLLSVPLFYLSAGMTLALNLERWGSKKIMWRVAKLVVAGYGFSAFVGGWRHVLDAQVLQSIGVGIAFMLALSQARLGWWWLYGASVLVASGREAGEQVLIPEYRDLATIGDFLSAGARALFFEGNFPVFAWSGFIALGYTLRKNPLGWGLSLRHRMVVGIILMLAGSRLAISKYPMSLGYLFFFSGLCLLATAVLDGVSGKIGSWCSSTLSGRVFVFLSRHSLKIYLGHFLVGISLIRFVPELKGPIWMVLPLGGLVVIAIGILAYVPVRLRNMPNGFDRCDR
jgi:uncharacterized membrane protein